MPLVNLKRQVLAKAETTKGTAIALAAANAKFLCENPRFKLNADEVPRNLTRSSISTLESLVGPLMAEMTFRTEFKGSGAVGTAPQIGTLLQACGFAETLATNNVTYAPSSSETATDTLTLACRVDGYEFKMCGARGNVSFVFGTDGCWCDWTFRGKFSAAADVALEATVAYEATKCLQAHGNAATFDFNLRTAAVTTFVWSQLTLDMNNTVAVRTNANSADASGLAYAMITARDPGGSLDFQAELAATHDFMRAYRSSYLGTMSWQLGSTAGNICTLNFAGLQITGVDDSDRDGVATMDCAYKLRSVDLDGGNDELTLVFT